MVINAHTVYFLRSFFFFFLHCCILFLHIILFIPKHEIVRLMNMMTRISLCNTLQRKSNRNIP